MKKLKMIKQPRQNIPQNPQQRRPVKRAALFHRKGSRNS